LPAGSDTVTASYPGDATNQPSSASVAQGVSSDSGSTGSSGGSGGGGGFSGVDVGGLFLLLITAMARRRTP
jgi:hypothetical protein